MYTVYLLVASSFRTKSKLDAAMQRFLDRYRPVFTLPLGVPNLDLAINIKDLNTVRLIDKVLLALHDNTFLNKGAMWAGLL